ncbi:tetratricopeptide repeat protein [Oharaeibacter diazotrophicus]|uniref:protein O-GlcNAc transferase n=1 Tax=Oharaeibacter diazotrophicus TaxID=1920512 RepID=A0A4R6RLX6_9HYPH|nr:tetratricopeptide repeat protein [Oharaeibacter diazotrophicus]TDP86756.1 putative O-linked N-acetylglucosamine transferase (SPINDLY family) [Oharaeibacter diazotrophicus]BBE71301.1 tetratricopeptide repeat protein [Pleomorphomonas sp. SM30]GLS78056.1 hypothetical protein GCM10007904_33930 [Oharaeibacter diazotrophicus]
MVDDVFASEIGAATGRGLGVMELIRSAETLKAAGELAAVGALYGSWIQHNRDNGLLYAVLFNYAVVLTDAGDLQRARDCLEQALQLKPDFMPAHINLGRVHERMGAVGTAVQQWSQVVDRLPQIEGNGISHKLTALNQIARTLEGAGQDESAEAMLRQSLDIDCHQREVSQHFTALRQRACEWPVVQPWERAPRAAQMKAMSPLSAAAYSDDPLFQLAVAANYNAVDVGTPAAAMDAWPKAAARADRPIRIGYLSSDLREHAVGHLMAEVFGLHDRGAVEVYAYYCGIPAADPMHEAYKAAADRWVDVSRMDDATAARRIADDGIQILVDVNGYTREGRTKLLALRPAPVIVNWLGYPGTLGSPYHRYVIADEVIIPPDHELYYSEKVLRLPCYQPNNRNRVVAPVGQTRAEAGLPETGTVFCCFNGAHKITPFTLDRWLTILDRVPGSVLWLLAGADAVAERLKARAAARGVDPARLVFAPKLDNPHHLARYPLADLFLDTTPYGAHTTASDALYMGVPVLTYAGRCFASRVCGSLVTAAGLPDLVAGTAEGFVDKAVALGRDPAALAALKARLAENRDTCTLFDMPGLVRALEGLYGEMWADFRAGALPEPDLSNMDVYLEVGIEPDHEAIEVQTIADYEGWWRERLERRNRVRPFPHDRRAFPAR